MLMPRNNDRSFRVMRDRAGDLNHTFNNLLDALKFDVGKFGSRRIAKRSTSPPPFARFLSARRIAIALSRTLDSTSRPISLRSFATRFHVLVNIADDALKGSSSRMASPVLGNQTEIQGGIHRRRHGQAVCGAGEAPSTGTCRASPPPALSQHVFRSVRRDYSCHATSSPKFDVTHSGTSDTETCVSIELPGRTRKKSLLATSDKSEPVGSRAQHPFFVEVAQPPAEPRSREDEVLGLISLVVRLRDLVSPLSAGILACGLLSTKRGLCKTQRTASRWEF